MKTPTPEQLRLAAEIIETGCAWEVASTIESPTNPGFRNPAPGKDIGWYLTDGDWIIRPLPPIKKQVPLEPSDVPPGSVIRGAGEADDSYKGWCMITSCSPRGVRYWWHCDDHKYSAELMWVEMMEAGMQILRPGSNNWEPCHKQEA